MLQKVFDRAQMSGAGVEIAKASFPSPFASGLEYSAPARGTWNIVHTGMLLPGAHQVFVCAQGCLRGVVLTAAEMGAAERFSTVAIREHDVLDGDMVDLIVEGVSDILGKLPELPSAVLVYTSCIHHFIGCDLDLAYRRLRERFPSVDFTDCYMNPIMRKSGLNPDQLMRRQLYSLLRPRPLEQKKVALIGGDLPLDDSCELVRLVRESGHELLDINYCRTYEEYQEMAAAGTVVTCQPAAIAAGEALARRLGPRHLYLPQCFDYEQIEKDMARLAEALGAPAPDLTEAKAKAEAALDETKAEIGDMPVVIDYTLHPRPLGLARLLLSHGFKVETVYADSFSGEEEADFRWLQENYPKLQLCATVHHEMRVLERKEEQALALGQKAAYFSGSDHFVNMVEGGGLYGFDGVIRLAELMREAAREKKDARALIQIKGLGCGGGCCG